jgi:hypothetical protein
VETERGTVACIPAVPLCRAISLTDGNVRVVNFRHTIFGSSSISMSLRRPFPDRASPYCATTEQNPPMH